jgi:16S rRNA (cytosine1402-N4)-methyltransferase
MDSNYHIPVLLAESIEGLDIRSEGIYVDVTFGGGGHSREILKNLKDGKLVSFDQDSDSLENIINDDRFIFVNHNFKYLKNFLRYYGFDKVDGILADLGVSSHDFDVAERGFSFRFNGELDMRMNQKSKLNAAIIVNEYEEEELIRVLREYGEIDNVKKVAAVILKERELRRIVDTQHLSDILRPVIPVKSASKYLAQIFQAIRIEVNKELDSLKDFLEDAADVLKPGGRLVIISYHSLEDRLVKNFLNKGSFSSEVQHDFFGKKVLKFRQVGKKLIVPTENEITINPRARSAKLRIAEKI